MEVLSRFEFAPLPQSRQVTWRDYTLALFIHGLLIVALTWSVGWRSRNSDLVVQAELWSAVPQTAAPRAATPARQAEPAAIAPVPTPKTPNPQPAEAEIALEQARERQAKEKAVQAERERQRIERERQQILERDRQEWQKRMLAEENKRKELEALRKEQQEAAEREKERAQQIKRVMELANASGDENAQGQSKQSSGPKTNYAGLVQGRIRPNIVFSDEVNGNPVAEVDVRTLADGTIVVIKLLRSSGNKAWDDAVLKAIEKTKVLPRDEYGTVPPALVISLRPKD